MGRDSNAKLEKRIARAYEEGRRSVQSKSQPNSALNWFRSIGAASILFGAFGLVQTFFIPSIIAVYMGSLLLLLDLALLEKFDKAKWSRPVIATILLVSLALFTKVVVLRKSPLASGYRVSGDMLEVYISNRSTEDDYESLDVKIKPDFPNDYIAAPEQITHNPGVSFYDAIPIAMTEKGESVMGMTPAEGGEATDVVTNFLRIHCDRLTPGSFLRIRMKLVRPKGRGREPVTEGVHTVFVHGTFKGRFKTYTVRENASPFPQIP